MSPAIIKLASKHGFVESFCFGDSYYVRMFEFQMKTSSFPLSSSAVVTEALEAKVVKRIYI